MGARLPGLWSWMRGVYGSTGKWWERFTLLRGNDGYP